MKQKKKNKKKIKKIVPEKKEENKNNFYKIALSVLLVPLVLSAAIATMLLSYMFVPIMMVFLVSSLIYWIIKLNKSQH